MKQNIEKKSKVKFLLGNIDIKDRKNTKIHGKTK